MTSINLTENARKVPNQGHDVHGDWRVITLAGQELMLRWIPAGRFEMGAGGNDACSTFDEYPRHTVELSSGYWLFDTPVTQHLWSELMQSNPSEFRSPSRPVESVSFHDVQLFLAYANEQMQGARLLLPTEAQWEYACRAGTQTDTWAGDIEMQGRNCAPVLEDLAWYSGNSSAAFRSTQGVDSTSWEQCEHYGAKAGTHPVGLKQPNPWGLHDMIGNVWEWCSDCMREYEESGQVLIDPVGGGDETVRCARGGSWRDGPFKQRASYRDQVELQYRNNFVGFRCLVEFDG